MQNIYGVYLIKDKNNGKEYVGSACGGCGIWNRWKDYVADGHGGNKELKKIVKDKGFEYIQNNFHYTLLEQSVMKIRQQNEILHIFYSFNIFNAMFWE